MELLLKRNEKPGAFGTRYDLFAKLELKPEEAAVIRKATPEKTFLWQPDRASGQRQWRRCLIPGGFLAFIAGILAAVIFHPILFFPVAAIAWIPLTKLVFNQRREGITVSDLLTGRTIHCKSLDELLVKENDIREKAKKYCQNIVGAYSLGNEQHIDLGRD
jgi:hypothetical protein